MEKKITTKVIKKPAVKKPAVVEKDVYIEGVGRRKTSVARVRIYTTRSAKKGSFDIIVNEKPYGVYFPLEKQKKTAIAPFTATDENIPVSVVVKGGGINGQAEALRLGLSRALVAHNPAYREKLKALGFMKRDPRMVERKKFGSRKARRPQQWRKR